MNKSRQKNRRVKAAGDEALTQQSGIPEPNVEPALENEVNRVPGDAREIVDPIKPSIDEILNDTLKYVVSTPDALLKIRSLIHKIRDSDRPDLANELERLEQALVEIESKALGEPAQAAAPGADGVAQPAENFKAGDEVTVLAEGGESYDGVIDGEADDEGNFVVRTEFMVLRNVPMASMKKKPKAEAEPGAPVPEEVKPIAGSVMKYFHVGDKVSHARYGPGIVSPASLKRISDADYKIEYDRLKEKISAKPEDRVSEADALKESQALDKAEGTTWVNGPDGLPMAVRAGEAEEEGDEEVYSQPEPGDYIIAASGPLGSLYRVGVVEGKSLGEKFKSWEDAMAAIKADMEKSNFFPNVWYQDDHGGIEVVNMSAGLVARGSRRSWYVVARKWSDGAAVSCDADVVVLARTPTGAVRRVLRRVEADLPEVPDLTERKVGKFEATWIRHVSVTKAGPNRLAQIEAGDHSKEFWSETYGLMASGPFVSAAAAVAHGSRAIDFSSVSLATGEGHIELTLGRVLGMRPTKKILAKIKVSKLLATGRDLNALPIAELEALIDNWMGVMGDVTEEATKKVVSDRVREAEAILQKKKAETAGQAPAPVTAAVKAGITRLPSGRWRDTNGNSYNSLEDAADAEAWLRVDDKLDGDSEEAKTAHAEAVEDILSNFGPKDYEPSEEVRKSFGGKLSAKETKDARAWISRKIKKLIAEGKDQKQAEAEALNMARKKGYKVPVKAAEESGVEIADFLVEIGFDISVSGDRIQAWKKFAEEGESLLGEREIEDITNYMRESPESFSVHSVEELDENGEIKASLKASAFDEIPEIDLGDGMKARRKKAKAEGGEGEEKEIEIVDGEDKVVETFADAFGDDSVTIIKCLRQILDIKAKPAKEKDGKAADGDKPKGGKAEDDLAEKPLALPAVKEKKELDAAAQVMEEHLSLAQSIAQSRMRNGQIQAKQADIDAFILGGMPFSKAQIAAAKQVIDKEIMSLLGKTKEELQGMTNGFVAFKPKPYVADPKSKVLGFPLNASVLGVPGQPGAGKVALDIGAIMSSAFRV